MKQRPTHRRGQRPAAHMQERQSAMYRQSEAQLPECAGQDILPEAEAKEAAPTLPAYRNCVSANGQPLPPGEALGWGQSGWPWQSALPLAGAQNLLLLNLTFVSETDGTAQWTLRLGDHTVAVLTAAMQAGEPVTVMLNLRLPAEADAAVTLWNDSESTVVVQQGSINIMTLEV